MFDEYENQMKSINEKIQRKKTLPLGKFKIIVPTTCDLNLPNSSDESEEDKTTKPKTIEEKQCKLGNKGAKELVYSSMHFMLKETVSAY